mgnify:CR=1 FL=1
MVASCCDHVSPSRPLCLLELDTGSPRRTLHPPYGTLPIPLRVQDKKRTAHRNASQSMKQTANIDPSDPIASVIAFVSEQTSTGVISHLPQRLWLAQAGSHDGGRCRVHLRAQNG